MQRKKLLILAVTATLKLLFISLSLTIVAGCAPAHHHKGARFILNPQLSQFGGQLIINKDTISVKSYFKSSIYFRTEYIYENLDLTLARAIEPGKEYPLEKLPSLWYAKGGQGGHIETKTAKGTYTVIVLSPTVIKIRIRAELYNFTKKGALAIPEKIQRQGILTARTGYEL